MLQDSALCAIVPLPSVLAGPAPACTHSMTFTAHSLHTQRTLSALQVLAKAGDEVVEGQPLLILEAMKMEHVIKAPAAGKCC